MSESAQKSSLATSTKAVYYTHDAGWTGDRKSSFRYAGNSRVRVTFSHDKRQEIGLWETPIDPARIESAQMALRESRYKETMPRAPVPPETKFACFLEELANDAEEDVFWCFPLNALPQSILPVIDKFEALIELVRAHPVRVLRGSGKWTKPEFRTDEDLEMEITLTGIGTSPLEAGNPFIAGTDGPKGFLRLAIEPEPFGQVEELHADLTPSNLVAQTPEMKALIVRLSPGETWTIRLGKRVYAVPGRYRGRLSYVSAQRFTKDGPETEGEIPIDLGEMTVVPKRR